MSNFEQSFCRLCLTAIVDKNYTIIETCINDMLDVLLLKLKINETTNVLCNNCSAKLFAAFEFKSTCLYTNNIIKAYAGGEEEPPLDIKNIYVKEMDNKELLNTSDSRKVCRLCMQLVTSEFMTLKEVDHELLQTYLPEINFHCTRDPVVCEMCFNALYTHVSFLDNCLIAQTENENGEDSEESEEDDRVEQQSLLNVTSEDFRREATVIKEEAAEEQNEMETEKCSPESEEYVDARIPKWSSSCESKDSNTSKIQVYKCKNCDYKTKHKRGLTRHALIHKDPSKGQIHECEVCHFRTNRKSQLTRHELKHKDVSEVQMYQCKECDYQTKHKWNLRWHEVRHRPVSEVQMYKCDDCDFQTKRKQALTGHKLMHRSLADIQMYKCTNCDYQTKHKKGLVDHELKHKDASQVQMYKCKECDFETKRKQALTRHELRHKGNSEVQMYKCKNCDYQTRHKRCLTDHELMHKDASEVQMYKCKECGFETKRKQALARHELTHKSVSDVQMYKCKECSFKTKYKGNLVPHMSNHMKNLENKQMEFKEEPSETDVAINECGQL